MNDIRTAFFSCLFGLSLVAIPLSYADAPGLMETEEPHQLIVNNRILAKVNGKTISVIDVMKKMDIHLNQNYPHLTSSKIAHFQFYNSQWRSTLAQMIDSELMMADAEHLELKVKDAEVREEILQRFGPNVIPTLDKLGMTYEEARKMVLSEMIVQRMQWYRVNSKALQKVNPQDIKEAYKDYCEKNPSLEEWRYQMLSVRSEKPGLGEQIAKLAFESLKNHGIAFAAVADQLKQDPAFDPSATIAISPEYSVNEKTVSQAHKDALFSLAVGSYSEPIAQISRVDGSMVYRIFFLKDHSKVPVPPFEKLAEKLRDDLMQKAFVQENSQYISKLRERLGYDEKHMTESLPTDFQPFVMR